MRWAPCLDQLICWRTPGPTVYNWVMRGVVSARRSDGSARWLILADDTELARPKERREAAARRTEDREKAWDKVAGKHL